MLREIIHDPDFLALPSSECTEEDLYLYEDLMDTLRSNSQRCVGMAANMIGVRKKAIIFCEEDGSYTVMFNPVITDRSPETYETEEGCLSLEGKRKTKRHVWIEVMFLNRRFRQKIRRIEGFTAQIVQHEIDHTLGILI